MITFSISALEKAPVKRSGELPVEFFDLAADDAFAVAGEGKYDLTAQLVSGGVLVSGTASAPLGATCGRCLKPVSFTLDAGDIQLFFEIGENQELLEVDEELRAELLLALPMNPVCSSDCQGLCPVCGCDLNENECSCAPSDSASAVSPWSALDGLEL